LLEQDARLLNKLEENLDLISQDELDKEEGLECILNELGVSVMEEEAHPILILSRPGVSSLVKHFEALH